jgi:hypothetical protein
MSEQGADLWLLQQERRSRQEGSGLTSQQLVGNWRLVDLWDRHAIPLGAQSRLLQLLQARLEIQPSAAATPTEPGGLRLRNTVRVGLLELAFHGPGWLQGRRPLLRFRFEALQLSLGVWTIWQQPLQPAAQGDKAFFALIAAGRDQQGRWLLARGRSGGLARWRCS